MSRDFTDISDLYTRLQDLQERFFQKGRKPELQEPEGYDAALSTVLMAAEAECPLGRIS
jgi:hypothetical protein